MESRELQCRSRSTHRAPASRAAPASPAYLSRATSGLRRHKHVDRPVPVAFTIVDAGLSVQPRAVDDGAQAKLTLPLNPAQRCEVQAGAARTAGRHNNFGEPRNKSEITGSLRDIYGHGGARRSLVVGIPRVDCRDLIYAVCPERVNRANLHSPWDPVSGGRPGLGLGNMPR
jgi:hypothetical protein